MISNRHIEIHPLVEGGRAWPPLLGRYFPGFYLDVGGRCNFACPYCSIDKSVPFRSAEEMERIVEIAGKNRLGTGIFIGGEPSIYPHLERVMEHGQRHGVSDYWIITNGSGLVHRPRVQRLHDLGMKVWHLSWDHFDKRVLAAYHGSRPVLANLMRAAENVSELRGDLVYLYQVVTRQTYPTLPQMVTFVADLRERFPAIQALVAAMVKAVQEALKNPEVLYAVEDAVPSLREAAAVASARSLPFWIFNLPPCVVPDLADIVFSPYELDRTLDLDTLELMPSRAADHCVKGPACLGCSCFDSCSGYLRAYEERFGSAVFRPPPGLRRAVALPESRLRPQETVRPPHAASDCSHVRAVPEGGVERITSLLDGFSHGGWRVHDLEWDPSAPVTRWVLSVGASESDTPLIVHLEPGDAPSSFLGNREFSVSYKGSSLPTRHERVVRALFDFLKGAGASVI
jgi:pyruvate-formate lyase-activating enzyme